MTASARLLMIALVVSTTAFADAQQRPRPRPGQDRPNIKNSAPMREPILQKLIEARGRLRYSGTRLVEFKSDGERTRTTEFVVRDGFRQRTEFGDGTPQSGQIIVEDQNQRLHYFPNKNEIRVLPPRADEIYGRFRRILNEVNQGRLRLRTLPGGMVAGIPTQMGEIVDGQGNPLQRFWVDMRTGMMLKRELFDPIGGKAGSFEFTRVNYEPIVQRGDFELNRRGARRVSPDDMLRQVAQESGIRPTRLPAQSPYKLEDVRLVELPNGKGMIQVYTGGEGGRFSFFQILGDVNPQRMARLVGGHLRAITWRKGELSFALVGDLPPQELEKVSTQLGR